MFQEKENTMEALRSIILEDDRKVASIIEQEIEVLKNELLVPENFSKKVKVLTQEEISHLKRNFGSEFKVELRDAVQRELKDSQDEVINALYPIIGKLIKKYLQTELEKITEQIDSQINNTFSVELWIRRIKAFFSGTDSSQIILSELSKPGIEEVFLIQNHSGMLLGSYSKNNLIEQDMIAGMLTAIKAFAEDAFHKEGQSLSHIEYENYNILMYDFFTYKMAFVVSGVLSASFKNELFESAELFCSNYLKEMDLKEANSETSESIKKYLKQHFFDYERN